MKLFYFKTVVLLSTLTTTILGFEYRARPNKQTTIDAQIASTVVEKVRETTVPAAIQRNSLNDPQPVLTANVLEDNYCLVFEDHFDTFNFKNWQHEISLGGGGNWEFQYYTNNRSNSFVQDGVLYLKPTLTAETIGEAAVLNGGKISLYGGAPSVDCTDNSNYGCERVSMGSSGGSYLNPIQSARIRTLQSASIRYGKVEVKARLPKGDWLWPAIWMLPTHSAYGGWPASGEIDIIESRGNRKYPHGNSSVVSSALHWGPHSYLNKFLLTTNQVSTKSSSSWSDDFHLFGLEWTKEGIRTYVDDTTILQVDFDQTAWSRGQFTSPTMNPWVGGDISAPFDQEFHLILNVAVGGVTGYWPDDESKPWKNNDSHATNTFYDSKNKWLPTWGKGNDRALAVDWVRMWSLCDT
ncbi:MAG: concanavalin A-like lectin/glucanase domain-containing protein [Benjaminiella poitrasii]|nr:MAG: concanavalin A-like lectin/glucanase domain-containing protein [Benjaminiella poitrasii]